MERRHSLTIEPRLIHQWWSFNTIYLHSWINFGWHALKRTGSGFLCSPHDYRLAAVCTNRVMTIEPGLHKCSPAASLLVSIVLFSVFFCGFVSARCMAKDLLALPCHRRCVQTAGDEEITHNMHAFLATRSHYYYDRDWDTFVAVWAKKKCQPILGSSPSQWVEQKG